MTRYNKTMTEALLEVREKFQSRGYTTKEVKMAIGIASDKRYAGGNYTGAVNAIEKIKKGLSKHPQVAAVLKRQNEMKEEPASPDEGNMAVQQLEFMMHAVDRMKMHIAQGGEFPEWMQNKLSGAHEKLKGLYANIEHGEMKSAVEAFNEEVKDFREKQQDLTELNGDGNRDRGRYGEDLDEKKNQPYPFRVNIRGAGGATVKAKDMDDAKVQAFKKLGIDPKKLKDKVFMKKVTVYSKFTETSEETLEELAMPRRDFEKLKKGDKVTITYDSSIRRGTTTTFTVTGKSKSAKYDVEKVSMTAGGKGKYYLYSRKGGDATLALGDMGASMTKIVKEEVELDEKREPFAVIDTADGDKVVGTASDEKGAKSIITSAELPPMKIKDKKTLKIVKVKKKQDIGYPLKEEKNCGCGQDPCITYGKVDELSMSIKDLKKSGIRKQDTSKLKKDLEKLKKGLKKEEPQKPDSAKAVDQMRDDKKKTRIAQLQLQIAKAQETINKINAQEKPSE